MREEEELPKMQAETFPFSLILTIFIFSSSSSFSALTHTHNPHLDEDETQTQIQTQTPSSPSSLDPFSSTFFSFSPPSTHLQSLSLYHSKPQTLHPLPDFHFPDSSVFHFLVYFGQISLKFQFISSFYVLILF